MVLNLSSLLVILSLLFFPAQTNLKISDFLSNNAIFFTLLISLPSCLTSFLINKLINISLKMTWWCTLCQIARLALLYEGRYLTAKKDPEVIVSAKLIRPPGANSLRPDNARPALLLPATLSHGTLVHALTPGPRTRVRGTGTPAHDATRPARPRGFFLPSTQPQLLRSI